MKKWTGKKPLKEVRAETIAKIDKLFSPDLRVKIDKNSVIIGFEPVSPLGANYVLHNAGKLLEANYDSIDFQGLCVETNIPEEWE